MKKKRQWNDLVEEESYLNVISGSVTTLPSMVICEQHEALICIQVKCDGKIIFFYIPMHITFHIPLFVKKNAQV
jgi:hypothetical protein